MLVAHFSRHREADPGRLHFAAHSHHPWPDATQAAHAAYWLDSARLLDRKWERVLGEVVPRAQGHVARLLRLSDARQVAFAPNTHEFVSRLFSCLDDRRPARVLTTAHEFHSFRRQARRLVEAGRIVVEESEWATGGGCGLPGASRRCLLRHHLRGGWTHRATDHQLPTTYGPIEPGGKFCGSISFARTRRNAL